MTRNRSSPTIQQALKDLPIKEAAAVLATHDIQVPREILRLKKAFLAFLRANPPQRNVALALISAHVARKDKLNAARRRRHAVRCGDNLEELGERDEIDGDGAEAPPLQRNQIIRPVNFGKVSIAPDDACGHCGALKMKGEGSTFCCNNGKYIHSQLGLYTEGFRSLLQWGKVADACRKVNNMFTLASMSTVDGNYRRTTPINLPALSAVKIHGRILRRSFAADQGNPHCLQYILYDDLEAQDRSGGRQVPISVIRDTRNALFDCNPLFHQIALAHDGDPTEVGIELDCNVSSAEVTAHLRLDNTTQVEPRHFVFWRKGQGAPHVIDS